MAPKSPKARKSCAVCRHADRKDATIVYCSNCNTPYHDVCQAMTEVRKSLSGNLITALVCNKCKLKISKPKTAKKVVQSKDESKLHENLTSAPLLASTPAHPAAAIKASTLAKRVAIWKAPIEQRNDSSNSNLSTPQRSKDDGNSGRSSASNNASNTSNNTSNNSSNTTSFSAAGLNSSLKLLDKSHCNGTILSTLINYANLTSTNIDKRLGETKTDITERLDGMRGILDIIPAINVAVAAIHSSLDEIQQKFDEQNSQLAELNKTHSLLVNENKTLK